MTIRNLARHTALLDVFHALADENRLRVLEVLQDGEHCVCDIQAALAVGQSLLSHHLRVLREAGLVRDRHDGRWVYYAIAPETLERVEEAVSALRAAAANPREPYSTEGDTSCAC